MAKQQGIGFPSRREHVAAERSKELYWREHHLRQGPAAAVALADQLRQQVIAQRRDWPSASERAEDHAAHLRLIDALCSVATRTG